ncbi:MAG TPA: neutral zinc metallopeptidase [Gemmatimonadaceae bacterium]
MVVPLLVNRYPWRRHAGWASRPRGHSIARGAAIAIGDDQLQRQSQGTVVPGSFTHGSSEQPVCRVRRARSGNRLDVRHLRRRRALRAMCHLVTACRRYRHGCG